MLVAFVGRAQFNITQNLGSPNTLVKNPNYGGLQGGLIPFTFEDTTAANLTNLKYYAGLISILLHQEQHGGGMQQ